MASLVPSEKANKGTQYEVTNKAEKYFLYILLRLLMKTSFKLNCTVVFLALKKKSVPRFNSSTPKLLILTSLNNLM